MAGIGLPAGRYAFTRDGFCRSGLFAIPLIFGGVVAWMALEGDGAYYLAAVTATVLLALAILMMLSIPRYVNIGAQGIEIVCLMEVKMIPSAEIASIEWIDRLPLRGSLPIGCMAGFGGYCGYWFSLRTLRPFKIYASQRVKPLLVRRRGKCDIITGGFC
jgi:hypothetical protein